MIEAAVSALTVAGFLALASTAALNFRRGNPRKGWGFVAATVVYLPALLLIATLIEGGTLY